MVKNFNNIFTALLCCCFLALFIGPNSISRAQTNAWWAWPGMEFEVYKNSWYSCSVGFPAWDRYGNRYFITAGHCFRSIDGKTHYFNNVRNNRTLEVYSPSNLSYPVGWERTYFLPKKDGSIFDISLVQMYDDRGLKGSGWKHIPSTPAKNVHVGDRACLVGYRHRRKNCGVINELSVMERAVGNAYFDRNLIGASYCSHPGDSGGAVYNNAGALGINVIGFPNHNELGTPGECSSEFIPIDTVLARLRIHNPSLMI